MTDQVNLDLHPAQWEVFNDPSKFKLCVAGRRFGKSWLAVVMCLVEASKNYNAEGTDLKHKSIFYVSPTFDQGKRNTWRLFKDLGAPLIKQTYENTGVIELINGRIIEIKGADRPDMLRGAGLSFVVLDEFADMKPNVWEEIIQPALTDAKGGALFIGSPKGKNHFYELWERTQDMEGWGHFEYTSFDNPYLDKNELELRRKNMPEEAFRQEHLAKFQSAGSGLLKGEWLIEDKKEPQWGSYYICVDPAGYADVGDVKQGSLKRLDETAISIVKCGSHGWWVKNILAGRWGVKETAAKIIEAAAQTQAQVVGIEKGALRNALMPYLMEEMAIRGIYPRMEPLTHGGKDKTQRILWALAGRMEHGRISFNPGPYYRKFVGQMLDFPNKLAHDDMLDALAYTDQLVRLVPDAEMVIDNWQPLDIEAGF